MVVFTKLYNYMISALNITPILKLNMTAQLSNKERLEAIVKANPLVSGDERIAVFGAGGQIGTKLRPYLDKYYPGQVEYCDFGKGAIANKMHDVDVSSEKSVTDFVEKHHVKVIINLAALLSGAAQENPEVAYWVNVEAPLQLLSIARNPKIGIRTVMMMSSMAIQEFDERELDTPEEIAIMKQLQKDSFPNIIRRGLGTYALQKGILEDASILQVLTFNKNTLIPRLAGDLNCHTPWPSDGTTEELDKMIVACAMQKAYPKDWEDRLRALIDPKHLAAGLYLRGSSYVPAVPADATFDMVDSKTLPEAVVLLLHQDVRARSGAPAIGPIHNVSEYTVSMQEAYDILKTLHPEMKIHFAADTVDLTKKIVPGLDRGKTERARYWSNSQNTKSTEALIGNFKQYDAKRSVIENYERVLKGLE